MQLNKAKDHLKKHGWTQGQAAQRFNVTESYLCRVLNGRLKSRRLMTAILTLPKNPEPNKRAAYERRAA